MFKVKELGEVIAIREMLFVGNDGSSEAVTLKIGTPCACDEPEAFICPYEISSKKHSRLFGSVGIDTVQALTLTMKTLKVDLDYWEKKFDGELHFLDEKGHGF